MPRLANAWASFGLCKVTAFQTRAASGRFPCCSKAMASAGLGACAKAKTGISSAPRMKSDFSLFMPEPSPRPSYRLGSHLSEGLATPVGGANNSDWLRSEETKNGDNRRVMKEEAPLASY